MSNKMKITISFADQDGVEEVEPVEVEVDIPNHKEFVNFREDFDKLERAVLSARKEASEKAIEKYMEEISKKKFMSETKNCTEKLAKTKKPIK
jgi:hypothetical protein